MTTRSLKTPTGPGRLRLSQIDWRELARLATFPDPAQADEHGLLAIGGDFRPEVLIAAYAQGIFPWPAEEMTYAWFSPEPRMILRPAHFHRSRSLKRVLAKGLYRLTFDTAFGEVVEACATVPRGDGNGTWIHPELRRGFLELHDLGLAHSAEVWFGEELVGGVYGLSLGSMFCGESMFHRRSNASKVALAGLCERLEAWDFDFLDCQLHTSHLESLGAREWTRQRFLKRLARALERPTRVGPWTEPQTSP